MRYRIWSGVVLAIFSTLALEQVSKAEMAVGTDSAPVLQTIHTRPTSPSKQLLISQDTPADDNLLRPAIIPSSDPGQASVPSQPAAAGQSLSPAKKFANSIWKIIGDSPSSDVDPPRRAPPAPLDAVFPGTEYIGVAGTLPMGVPDTDPVYPLERAIWKVCPLIKKARIKIYGWVNPGVEFSTSRNSNFPLSYNVTPNRLQLDQLVLRTERVPDTVQTKHLDWGFRYTQLFGIDYRFTTAQGWPPASNLLLNHNYLYGYDPVELYGLLYVPKVFQGMVLKVGRYISPPDIEASLAPDNYLYTHSLMFTVDTYTQTGVLASIQLNKHWMVQAGIHAGNDMAFWNVAATPTAQALVRWTSKSNNDSIYGGVDSVNKGYYRLWREIVYSQAMAEALGTDPPKVPGHDNLQQYNLTWSHRFFGGKMITMTEAYLLYQRNAFRGGTVNNGPVRSFGGGGGPGLFLPGQSPIGGFVNYTAIKLSKRDFVTLRPIDFLIDERGQRTGFPTTYASWTIGLTHRFSNMLEIRPEIRYERALSNHVNPYDNGLRRSQFTFGCDLIQRF